MKIRRLPHLLPIRLPPPFPKSRTVSIGVPATTREIFLWRRSPHGASLPPATGGRWSAPGRRTIRFRTNAWSAARWTSVFRSNLCGRIRHIMAVRTFPRVMLLQGDSSKCQEVQPHRFTCRNVAPRRNLCSVLRCLRIQETIMARIRQELPSVRYNLVHIRHGRTLPCNILLVLTHMRTLLIGRS